MRRIIALHFSLGSPIKLPTSKPVTLWTNETEDKQKDQTPWEDKKEQSSLTNKHQYNYFLCIFKCSDLQSLQLNS